MNLGAAGTIQSYLGSLITLKLIKFGTQNILMQEFCLGTCWYPHLLEPISDEYNVPLYFIDVISIYNQLTLSEKDSLQYPRWA